MVEPRRLPSFTKFQRDVAAAHPETSFTCDFLEEIYHLAEQRLQNEREAERQIENAADIRRMLSQSEGPLNNLGKMEAQAESIRTGLEAAGFRSTDFYRLCDLIENGIGSLVDFVQIGRQDAVDQIFPTKAHGLKQRKWESFRFYDLRQLGYRAAYSDFVLNSDKLLVAWCNANQRKLKKREEWAILQTFLHKLFKEEGVQVEAIERLVRDAAKRASRKPSGRKHKGKFLQTSPSKKSLI